MTDLTYVKEEIESREDWRVAWVLSEILNDAAPIGWSRYIGAAQCLLAEFDMKPKGKP